MDIEDKGSNLQVSISLIMQISNFHSQTHLHQSVDYLTPVCLFVCFFCPWISENVFIWYRTLGKNCFPSDIWRLYCIPVFIDPSYLIIVIAWLFVDDISFLSGSVYNLPFVLYALKLQKDVQLWIFFIFPFQFWSSSLVAQMVKNLPTMRETWVWSLHCEDLLEKGMATHSSILAWRTPWTEKPGRLPTMGSQRVGHDWASKHSISQF